MESKTLDQFYTNPLISDELVNLVKNKLPSAFDNDILEPSAGTGNFIKSLLNIGVKQWQISAYDLDPKSDNIIKQDYFKVCIPYLSERIVIGNPPLWKKR